MSEYEDKDLFQRYLELFGEDPPFPPKHIMKSLVRMKEDGTFEEKLKILSGKKGQEITKDIEKKTGQKLSINHPIFDIDFDKDK